MPPLSHFNLPGNWQDLPEGAKRDELHKNWNTEVDGWTKYSIAGNSGDPLNDNRDFYYNPLTTDLSNAVQPGPVIGWTAFPNRIIMNFPNASQRELFEYADNGPPGWNVDPDKATYRPGGPRGYQDEYCEWSITRDNDKNITKIDFTCENPEYWQQLFKVDENKVLELYQKLVSPIVTLDDISTMENGKRVYVPTNKWNRDTTNGAVHLVSAPNNLFAEIYLAAAATIIREHDGEIVTNKDQLIRCSQYGGVGRNSDPTIGSQVNTVIRGGGVKVSLKDPVGLYIQKPNFGSFQTPDNTDASEFWTFVRGTERQNPNDPDFGLHAVFEVPKELGYTVSDIRIDGVPILYASQITQKFEIALRGLGVPTTDPDQTPRACIGTQAAAKGVAAAPVDGPPFRHTDVIGETS